MAEHLTPRLPELAGLIKPRIMFFRVDGSDLPNAAGTVAALDVGANLAVARDDGANQVTITFNETLKSTPLGAWFTLKTTGDLKVDTVTLSTTTLIYTCVKSSDGSTAVSDVDVDILVVYLDDETVL